MFTVWRMQDYSDATLYQLTQQLAHLLLQSHLRLVTAESCTGGWIAKCCTDLPGSSAWFEGGIVSYSNTIKQNQLAVSSDTLQKYGAVSEATAREMVTGARQLFNADVALAVSGIAGPDGGSAEKPVGTVCFAWADSQNTLSETFIFDGDRDAVRRQAVFMAMQGLIQKILSPDIQFR